MVLFGCFDGPGNNEEMLTPSEIKIGWISLAKHENIDMFF